MRLILIALIIVSVSLSVSANCTDIIDGMTINESAVLRSDMYDLPSGITITGQNLVFDCETAILRGISGQSNTGITVVNATNVSLRNCNIVTYDQGLFLSNVTDSLIENNAFLKNRIGVRMFESYENILRSNNDKSRQVPISAISSKFNVVMLGNRNVDRAFCEENSCNKEVYLSPCEDGDFYCSEKCTAKTDSDCGPRAETSTEFKPLDIGLSAVSGKTVEQLEAEVRAEFAEKQQNIVPVLDKNIERPKLPALTRALIYILAYIFTLLLLQFARKK